MTPDRLTRPSVGLIPTMPQHVDGETIEPSVSVPIATAQRLAATATPEPELDPDGVRSRAYGLRHCPPRPLQPLDEWVERKFAHSERFALPSSTAPPARSRSTRKASRGGVTPESASDPAVLCIRSRVATLSFTSTGMPCSGPRGPLALRSASSAAACVSASGFASSPGRKPGEPPGHGQHHAAHCDMLEKRAAVHRPIAHGGLLVEMTGRGNGAKLAATRDSRPAMQQMIGGQSDVGKLRRVAVKHARDAFGDAVAVDRQWRDLRYLARPDVTAAWAEYEHFLALLEAAGVDTLRLPPDHTVGLDSLYARDVSIVCDRGVILCNMGKPQRRTEPAAQEAAFRAAGIPIWGRITGDGTVEGGDVCWIDERTLAVGRGYRTNDAGIRQLRELAGREICLKGGGGPTCLTRPLTRDRG